MTKLLIIEDDLDHLALVKRQIRRSETNWVSSLKAVTTIAEAQEAVGMESFDAILLDLNLPDSDGENTITNVIPHLQHAAIVVFTSLDNDKMGIQAVKGGAQDYLCKSKIDPDSLRRTVEFAIERFLHQSQLRRRNQELKMFAHTLAHEIRNPLYPVTLALDSLQGESGVKLPAPLEKMVGLGAQSAARISAIITELLSYANAEEEAIPIPVDFDNMVKEVIRDFSATHGDVVSFKMKTGFPKVLASEVPLRQVLENLISNAIRYRHPERDLELKLTWQSVEVDGTPYCQVSLADNGLGIAKADLQKIFEPFYRVKATSDREGTGLGLNFCRQTLERYEGTIDVASQVGLGSIFTMRVPICVL
ncbi:ATP-binding protein [bacterium]|nr:ATP-binding protein [bacterium]